MTTTTLEKQAPAVQGSQRSRGRAGVFVAMFIGLMAVAGTRGLTIDRRTVAMSHSQAINIESAKFDKSNTSLNAMPSYATALLLGGLRGPLAMVLWTSSENQKMDNDLQDIDTKIEWIRLLQPEFDTVHLFQIWNKAYNLSVKMSSLTNKYTTILDAIDYGQKVEKQRPDDLNIMCALGSIYGDKLGQSTEQAYYRRRVRRETQTSMEVSFPNGRLDEFRKVAVPFGWNEDESPLIRDNEITNVLIDPSTAKDLAKVFKGPDINIRPDTRHAEAQDEVSWRRLRLDPVLDVQGNIYSDLIEPRFISASPETPDNPFYDGSQLQFLKQYQPFPYGISTFAVAYNNFKRAQVLQKLWKEHPVQMSETIVDSRPAIYMEGWAEDEWERGRRFEMRTWGVNVETETRADLEAPTANVPLDRQIVDVPSREAALYSYDIAARLWADSRAELLRHLNQYAGGMSTYQSHIDDSLASEQLMRGDHDYLLIQGAKDDERNKLAAAATAEYGLARQTFAMIVLKYYVADEIAAQTYPTDPKTGQRYTKETIGGASLDQFVPTLVLVDQMNAQAFIDPVTHQYSRERDQFGEDRQRYAQFMARIQSRLASLGSHN